MSVKVNSEQVIICNLMAVLNLIKPSLSSKNTFMEHCPNWCTDNYVKHGYTTMVLFTNKSSDGMLTLHE